MTESKAQAAARRWLSKWQMKPIVAGETSTSILMRGVKEACLAGYAQGQRDLLEAARGVTVLCQCTDYNMNSFDDCVVKFSDLEALVKQGE